MPLTSASLVIGFLRLINTGGQLENRASTLISLVFGLEVPFVDLPDFLGYLLGGGAHPRLGDDHGAGKDGRRVALDAEGDLGHVVDHPLVLLRPGPCPADPPGNSLTVSEPPVSSARFLASAGMTPRLIGCFGDMKVAAFNWTASAVDGNPAPAAIAPPAMVAVTRNPVANRVIGPSQSRSLGCTRASVISNPVTKVAEPVTKRTGSNMVGIQRPRV